ncbi:cytosolic carboxypeptidase Nna1 isoform X2 [Calliphora vicina]|uniref:cytosolic carboxypeptidase Nna1 isoform X2 n=1 Tax=Calliphora vicina TaxID=7373 RepID=UPI00325BE178
MEGNIGFLGSFLSKGLKTNQLEVNTDEKTLRPIARLKEPRDLFALPKDKDNDCSQQAPRWPIECQVIEERIKHIPNVPLQPEPFYQQTGNELKPNPVGEENGIVVFNYNPISAVNYDKTKKSRSKTHIPDDSSDSDVSSCESQVSSPDLRSILGHDKTVQQTITKLLNTLEQRSSSNSNEEDDDEDDEEEEEEDTEEEVDKTIDGDEEGDKSGDKSVEKSKSHKKHKSKKHIEEPVITEEEIDSIWADKSPEYMAATPTFIKTQIDKNVKAQQLKAIPPVRLNDVFTKGLPVVLSSTSSNSTFFLKSNTDSPTEDGEIDADDNRIYQNKRFETNSLSFPDSYKKLKESPLFNADMSINLKELAKLSQTMTTPSPAIKISQLKSKSCKSSTNPSPELSLSPQDLSYNSVCSSNNSTPYSSLSDYQDHAKSNANPFPINDHKSNKCSYLPQFSRSAVGGSKFLTNCHPYNAEEYDGLEFESRFESGNLAKAIQITPTYYELYLRPDLYTSRSKQWFYFRVKRTKKNMIYRFSIVNLIKSDSLYNEGMRPVMYSNTNAKTKNVGWKRCGDNICYYRNDDDSQPSEDDEDNSSYTLTFNIEFEHDNDTVFFAHSYPYTYSDLQDYLMEIQKNPIKSKFCKLRLLCRTLAGNNVYYLTVTTPVANEEIMKRKKSIVVSARVHPSETPSSWMMKGLMDFITGESSVAKRLRHKFIFKLIPMLNPDGVIVGNTRNSLTGKDLNRQYRTVIRETYPSIWYTKALIKRLIDDCGVSMYCDMHAHSRRHNIFIYGCENKRNPEKKLTEQVFPLMLHKNVADKFSFENCKFKIQRSKEGTGRIVIWMLGITNSYTIEASFGGSLLGSRKGTHFTTTDYEHMGRGFCETLLDYCDENPNKVKRNTKLLKRIKKIRKREKREQKALKLKKLADQGCIIEEKFKVKQRTGKSVS